MSLSLAKAAAAESAKDRAAAHIAAASRLDILDMFAFPLESLSHALCCPLRRNGPPRAMKGREPDFGQPVSAIAPAQGEAISLMPWRRPVAGSRSTALGHANCAG